MGDVSGAAWRFIEVRMAGSIKLAPISASLDNWVGNRDDHSVIPKAD